MIKKKKNSKKTLTFERKKNSVKLEFLNSFELPDLLDLTLSLFVISLNNIREEIMNPSNKNDKNKESIAFFLKQIIDIIDNDFQNINNIKIMKRPHIFEGSKLSEKEIEMAETFSSIFNEKKKNYFGE
ncbi:MAG: hypothetical protein N3A58_05720 [Spirochaetes bacterium]|nr:hypothetical protein [Spirochaetota bacterium]